MSVYLFLKIYINTLINSIILTVKNFHAFILITVYYLIFYFGYFFVLQKHYFYAALLFFVFLFCISSTFYIIGQVVIIGHFSIKDLVKSFTRYFFRASFLIIFWFCIFFIINQFVITPISGFIKGAFLLYLIKIPLILLIFFTFNTFLEYIYLSKEPIESVFISSIKFMEKNWLVWLIPTIIIMFLLNLYDYRISIMPTLGFLSLDEILYKIKDPAFYMRSLILTIALIYRGLLFSKLTSENKGHIF